MSNKEQQKPKNSETETKKDIQEIKQEIFTLEEKKILEQKVIDLEKQNSDLLAKMAIMELDSKRQTEELKELAKNLETKAKQQIDKFRAEISEKSQNDISELKKYGSQKMLEALIEPLLNIELAIKTGKNQEGAVSNYVIGFEMLLSQLNDELASFGVSRIMPEVGQDFDPVSHHAISTKDGNNKNKIVEIKKPGYKLHDRVIKPATVIIEK